MGSTALTSFIPLHFTVDGFRLLYVCLTAYLWLATSIFSIEYFKGSPQRGRYWFFNLLSFAAIIGVFFSADFFTCFVFFEIMSLASYPLIAHNEDEAALRAAETTLAVSIISGLVLLMGIFLLWQRAGTLEFTQLYEMYQGTADKSALYLPAALMLVGFGAKAGMYPLHIWLPKAHPVAPAPASALLSGILTKTGIFGVIAISASLFMGDTRWGMTLMIFAAITMVWGAVRALFSTDLKRTLACSTVSQIGFILVGISMMSLLGAEGSLAIRGTILHMMNHTLIKLVLFVAAGVVYKNRHNLSYENIRGFGRDKPLFLFIFLMGALGIGGITFGNVYISKTLLHESILEAVHLYHGISLELPLQLLNALFLITGGLTIAYMTRLFITLFIQKGETRAEEEHNYMSKPTAIMLTATAALFPLLGSAPFVMDAIASFGQSFFHGHEPEHAVQYFTWVNEQGMLISIAIAIAVYFLVVQGLLTRSGEKGARMDALLQTLSKRFDLEDAVYRPLLQHSATALTYIARAANSLTDISPRVNRPAAKPPVVGRFSVGLLFVGVGILAAFLYVFLRNPYLR